MKLTDMFRKVQNLVDDTVDPIVMVDYFNACQGTIANITYIPKVVTVLRDRTTGYFLLPSDYNGYIRIVEPAGIITPEIYNDGIHFSGSDDTALTAIKIFYNKRLTTITNNPEFVSELPEHLHDIYVYYGAMQYMHPEEEPGRYAQFEKDYNRLVGELSKYMSQMRPRIKGWEVKR